MSSERVFIVRGGWDREPREVTVVAWRHSAPVAAVTDLLEYVSGGRVEAHATAADVVWSVGFGPSSLVRFLDERRPPPWYVDSRDRAALLERFAACGVTAAEARW